MKILLIELLFICIGTYAQDDSLAGSFLSGNWHAVFHNKCFAWILFLFVLILTELHLFFL